MNPTGNTNWDYLKALVAGKFKPGMSEWDMLFILAGPAARQDDSVNTLIRKWTTPPPLPADSWSNWDMVRYKAASLYKPSDSLNDLLRKITSASVFTFYNWDAAGNGQPEVDFVGGASVATYFADGSEQTQDTAIVATGTSSFQGNTNNSFFVVSGSTVTVTVPLGYYCIFAEMAVNNDWTAPDFASALTPGAWDLGQGLNPVRAAYPPLLCPALSLSGLTLSWSWHGANPDHWQIDSFSNADSTFVSYATVVGDVRSIETTTGPILWRLRGFDGSGNPVTNYSNTVRNV